MLARPWVVLIVALLIIGGFAGGLSRLVKDASVDAFVSLDHPAAQARERARAVFGVEDPMLVAFVTQEGDTLFTPERLEALAALSAALERVPGVRPDGVTSLATESALRGVNGDLFVDAIIPNPPLSAAQAQAAWERVQTMAPFMGILASEAGDAALIVVAVEDPDHATELYQTVADLAASFETQGVKTHVAGVAAMNGRLAQMVDGDTRLFVPMAVLVVLLVVLTALRRVIGLLGPLLVIAGSAAIGIGLMGWVDARYYLITTALPVIIMAIAVADSLHIALSYQRIRREDAALSSRQAALEALMRTWRPVTLTSLTTVAGFAGLALGASMIPIREFSIFASVGVVAAWVLSLTALPAVMVLTDLKPGRETGRRLSRAVEALVAWISAAAASQPQRTIWLAALFAVLLAIAGSWTLYDYERKRYFQPDDPVRVADAVINERFAGANVLDIVVSAPEPGGLMTSEAVAHMKALQTRLETAPYVTKVTGVADYIAIMHERLTDAAPGVLPQRANAAAQYMFLYEASGDPDDFKEEIDYPQQTALIRAYLDRDDFIDTSRTVAAFTDISRDWSAQTGLDATLSGRIAVNHGWMSALRDTHRTSLIYALVFVFLASLLVFRGWRQALVVMAPVVAGVSFVYAVMGITGIDLAPATSMCAAISTGLGVDFGIHLVHHITRRLQAGDTPRQAVQGGYLVVARACFFSALALAVGLAVVILSSAPALRWFGLLIAVGALGALIGALVIAPAAAGFLRTRRMGEMRHA